MFDNWQSSVYFLPSNFRYRAGESIMSAQPCGVYVSVADLKNAVSGTQDTTNQVTAKILGLMEQHWSGQDTVDVILMAECFWRWRYEITNGGNDQIKDFIFDAVMMRIKDEHLVPTVARKSDTKH